MAKKKEVILSILTLVILNFALKASAFEVRTNEFYVKFPSNWSCDQDSNLYVCTEQSASRQKPGVIVFQFGKASSLDTIDQFRTRLKTPRSIKGKGGLPLLSRVVSIQDRVINGHNWFESLHFEGELPEYYTYYLATRRGDMQFLMTLTAHSSEWDAYRPLFEGTIASIQLTNPLGSATTKSPQAQAPPQDLMAPQPMGGSETSFNLGERFPEVLSNMKKSTWVLMGSIIAACLMLLYAIKAD